MANSIILPASSLLPFVLSLLFFHVVVPMHAASPNDVVSTICQRTRNPPFCSNLLKSARTTDLKGLITFTINLAHTKATESRALAQFLASKAADPKFKERYASCAKHYDDAASDLNDAKNYLATGDYDGVNIQASGAMTETDDCQDNFTQSPMDGSGLSKHGKALEDICSIILVIANILLGRV
ncbi:pectinesterase inhibitor-like [Benincasa hispida]|uniref:pectinesterase inhibitor-like n=1 Tax=Benincasa hispida TaxID=102211 RepID=UPI0019011663|nr:pectinesterase inhibitor-like [Benincasa hispida]